MKIIHLLTMSLLTVLFHSCSSSAPLNQLNLLTGRSWELASLLDAPIDPENFPAGIPYLQFIDAGRLSGFTGCNNFSGGFILEGANLELDPGAMTKKACPGTGEEKFIQTLSKVSHFKVSKDQLTLMDGDSALMSLLPRKN